MTRAIILGLLAAVTIIAADLEKARDQQDRAALDRMVTEFSTAAQQQPNNAQAQYQLALAESYAAEVATELRDRNQAKSAAEAGVRAAERAVALKPDKAEYHRILGTLCGQAAPGGALLALKYGKCALDSVNKAIELDPKSSNNYLSRGVGNFYLPPQFGGGLDSAIRDFEKATQLNPKSSEAYLWLGLALRKANRNSDARKAFAKSIELNPNRLWTKQQLEKTQDQ